MGWRSPGFRCCVWLFDLHIFSVEWIYVLFSGLTNKLFPGSWFFFVCDQQIGVFVYPVSLRRRPVDGMVNVVGVDQGRLVVYLVKTREGHVGWCGLILRCCV